MTAGCTARGRRGSTRLRLTLVLATILLIVLGLAALAPNLNSNGSQNTTTANTADRYASIPQWAPKYTPENDTHPPVLHSSGWLQPVPMAGPINTAGAEDSPFVTPDGNSFFLFFTPNLRIDASQQIGDGVTGIWWSTRTASGWSDPVRVYLGSDYSLDGCEFVQGDIMTFCSVRVGNYRSVDLYTARLVNGAWTDVRDAGKLINQVYQVGEPAFSPDNRTMYYGSGGSIWALDNVGGNWTDPHLVPGVQITSGESLPFVTPDGQELWFTGYSTLGFAGPSLFMSRWNGTAWAPPLEIVSQFAGEPTLDAAGNLYFVHHFLDENGSLAEADIYVAYHTTAATSSSASVQQVSVWAFSLVAGTTVAVPAGRRGMSEDPLH